MSNVYKRKKYKNKVSHVAQNQNTITNEHNLQFQKWKACELEVGSDFSANQPTESKMHTTINCMMPNPCATDLNPFHKSALERVYFRRFKS